MSSSSTVFNSSAPRDYSPLSAAAHFFHSYPRFKTQEPFSLKRSYFRSVIILSIPYFAIAIILTLITFITIFAVFLRNRYRKRRPSQLRSFRKHPILKTPTTVTRTTSSTTTLSISSISLAKHVKFSEYNNNDTDPNKRYIYENEINTNKYEQIQSRKHLILCSSVYASIIIILSLLLFNVIYSMKSIEEDINIIFSSFRNSINFELFIPIRTMMKYIDHANSSSLTLAYSYAPDIILLRRRSDLFNQLFNYVNSILKDVQHLESCFLFDLNIIFVVACLSIIFVFLTLFFILFSDLQFKYRYHCYPKLYVLLIITVSLISTWSLSALSTSYGVASGDFCDALYKFRIDMGKDQDNKDGVDVRKNVSDIEKIKDDFFSSSSFYCDTHTKLLEEAQKFLNSTKKLPTFPTSLDHLMNSTDHELNWSEAATYMQLQLEKIEACNSSKQLVSNLLYSICGASDGSDLEIEKRQEISLSSTLACIWTCSIGTSLMICLYLVFHLLQLPLTSHIVSMLNGNRGETESDDGQSVNDDEDDAEIKTSFDNHNNDNGTKNNGNDHNMDVILVEGEGVREYNFVRSAWCADINTDTSSSNPSSGLLTSSLHVHAPSEI